MNACIKTGAYVHMLAHDVVFAADLFEVAGAIVVRANGPLIRGRNCWARSDAICDALLPTHELIDSPMTGFWREDLGIFVVLASQLLPIYRGTRS